MRKSILLAIVALLFVTVSVNAQQATTAAPVQQQAPNALTKIAILKLVSAGFDHELVGKAFPIFSDYYTVLQDAPAGEAAALAVKRDEKLKLIFSEAQMKTWKTTVEPALNAAQ
jgi:hypothetical protein